MATIVIAVSLGTPLAGCGSSDSPEPAESEVAAAEKIRKQIAGVYADSKRAFAVVKACAREYTVAEVHAGAGKEAEECAADSTARMQRDSKEAFALVEELEELDPAAVKRAGKVPLAVDSADEP